MFRSERKTFIRYFIKCIEFSIHFTKVFWSSNKTTKEDYGLIMALGIHIEMIIYKILFGCVSGKFFLYSTATRHKDYYVFFVVAVISEMDAT